MRDDVIVAVREQKLALAVAIERGRSVGMLVLECSVAGPLHGPTLAARCGVETNDPSSSWLFGPHFPVDQLQVEPPLIEHRRTGHAELQIQLFVAIFDVEFPDTFSVLGEASQIAGAEKRPNVLAIGGRR